MTNPFQRRLLAFLLLAAPATQLTGQGRTLRGVVVDSSGKAVPSAVVITADAKQTVQVRKDGGFRLRITSDGICSFEVLGRGYQPARFRLESCPDTAMRVVLRATSPADRPGPRCGTRSSGPCEAPGGTRFTRISAGYSHTCALSGDGTAWCWGDGRKGALGDGSDRVERFPQRVDTPLRFVEIGAGGDFTCARTAEGAVYCWGAERTVPGWPNAARTPARVSTTLAAASISVGRRHACLLDPAGRAACWGFNVDAETGVGTAGIEAPTILSPTPVAGNHTFRMLSAGSGFTCGIDLNSAVMCWGSNIDGAVGDGAQDRCGDIAAVPCALTPVAVAINAKVTGVSAGSSHTCVVTEQGTVFCWGSNALGQFGFHDPRAAIVRSPRSIELEPGVRIRSIHAGGIHSCAVSDRGQLYCWGADSKSLTNLAHWSHELRPRLVAGGARFNAISVGQVHYCVLDGSRAKCWGETVLGALGNR